LERPLEYLSPDCQRGDSAAVIVAAAVGNQVGGVAECRDATGEVQLGPTPDEQDLGRVHLGVDRQGNHRVLAQGLKLRSVLRSAHTISEPFQVKMIGTLRGVPSMAT
jgi:hypothetical protein